MENYNKAIELAKEIIAEANKLAENPTKAGRARIRKSLNEIKKAVTSAKNELIAADKGE